MCSSTASFLTFLSLSQVAMRVAGLPNPSTYTEFAGLNLNNYENLLTYGSIFERQIVGITVEVVYEVQVGYDAFALLRA